ncbi:partner of Y14 and mago [Leptopilina heterotoma]|uniref:partner of Y14 and mago n=1 Tax=Leptopilina heterotoma TaxID=63436 RepID=UPI001CA89926|nr:partner of Y14 and mago [Leptopilina heterotoma]
MASGYIKDDQGGTFIPASQRPDGTWRKPRRVKDGYIPQEEVPLYESKGKEFVKNKPAYPVGFSPEFIAAHKAKVEAQAAKAAGATSAIVQNDAAKKKKKKKNKNKSANVEKLTEDLEKATIIEPIVCKPLTNNTVQSGKINKSENTEKDEQIVDPIKRLKTLKKKIREIETLELKIKSGEIKNPDKEMKDKVLKKSSILKEIKQIEKSQ